MVAVTDPRPDTSGLAGLRPAPDGLAVAGALLAAAGYLLPWFRMQPGYAWSFSGWTYASLTGGGGWTLITFGWLALALAAALWARASPPAAVTTLVGAVGGMMFALSVVAVSFAQFPEKGTSNWIVEIPFDIGMPVMALGFSLLIAGGVRAIVHTAPASAPRPDAA